MTTEEIFSLLDERGIGGMMFHQQMADYYDFLNTPDYAYTHNERFKEESESLRDLHHHYISHYCKLIPQNRVVDPKAIPDGWQRYSKMDITKADRMKYIAQGFEKWIAWEKDTKDIYSKCYTELLSNKEYTMANCILRRIEDVDHEICEARGMYLCARDMFN